MSWFLTQFFPFTPGWEQWEPSIMGWQKSARGGGIRTEGNRWVWATFLQNQRGSSDCRASQVTQRICLPSRRHRFDPWVGKTPCRRKWQPISVFLLENPMDRGAWQAMQFMGLQRARHNWATKQQTISDCRMSEAFPSCLGQCRQGEGDSFLTSWGQGRGCSVGQEDHPTFAPKGHNLLR